MNTSKTFVRTLTALTLPALCLLTSCGKGADDNGNSASTNYEDLVIGKDFTDLNAKLTFITNRTDLIQDTPDGKEFPDYIEDFNALYPDIAVTIEGIADYDTDMAARLDSGSWGDICCVPSAVSNLDYPNYFEPIGVYDNLEKNYEFADQCMLNRTVYGIPTSGNVQGIVYNKRIWAEAGITELPKTPDEFLHDLELIRENTDSIPLYTNYEAIWPLGTWDTYIFSCATGDENFKNFILPYEKSPFSRKSDKTGPYEVYNILYQAVKNQLVEDNPAATSWELSKGALNRGEISAMVLGSWAVSQIQGADSNPQDVGYMPFPISVNGVQYSVATGDYAYGINCKISDEKKTAAKIFIKYMVENSGYALDQGSIPVMKGGQYPEALASFQDTILLKDLTPNADESDMLAILNTDSEMLLSADSTHVIRIIDAALSGDETLDEIVEEWNKAWNDAQERNNVTVSDS